MITFTRQFLESKNRPDGYVEMMRACAVRVDGDRWTFDEQSDCFQKLRVLFAPQPSPNDPTTLTIDGSVYERINGVWVFAGMDSR